MISFFIHKAFFDGWDNLFKLAALNVGFLLVSGVFILGPDIVGASLPFILLGFLLTIAATGIWWSACVHALSKVADYQDPGMQDFRRALRDGLVPGLQFSAMAAVLVIILAVAFPFYLGRSDVLSIVALGVIFWSTLGAMLTLQYFLPLQARLGGGFRKNLRKSFYLMMDNPLFSLFLLVYNALVLAISMFLAFLVPGPAALALNLNVAVKLRLYKYDWLEANPESRGRKIPWLELLAEDKERVGKRTLKGMIFPWKD
jgi:protein-S-isoprenylcysteine O-methyltransferase Ste14